MATDDKGRIQCSKCKHFKEPNRFSKHNRKANGLRSECKTCANLRTVGKTIKNVDSYMKSLGLNGRDY